MLVCSCSQYLNISCLLSGLFEHPILILIFQYHVRTLGLRSTPSLTPAQAYAARWDLSPNPSPRTMPIIPRGATAEPLPPPGTIHAKKSSSIKERRSSSKVCPLLLTNRSLTFDESHLVNPAEENHENQPTTVQHPITKLSPTTNNHPTTHPHTTICPTLLSHKPPSHTLPPLYSHSPSPHTCMATTHHHTLTSSCPPAPAPSPSS